MRVRTKKTIQNLAAVLACLAGSILALPMAAQQEVNPDRFDQQPSTARPDNAVSVRKTATLKNKKNSVNLSTNKVGSKRSKSQESLTLKADAKTRPTSR